MSRFFFTSESVSQGHPDKLSDQISDAILDACLAQDPNSKVACETLLSKDLLVLAGEITTKAQVDYVEIAKKTIEKVGYTDAKSGFNIRMCKSILSISEQSPDIAQGVNEGEGVDKEQGAGDQGLMFGFACDETVELMPLPIMIAHKIIHALRYHYEEKTIPYLRPDAKCQVTVEYEAEGKPLRVDTIVISTQHSETVTNEQIERDMKKLVAEVIPDNLLDESTNFFINPTGRFVIGGPAGDCGLTGRKIIVDTYGGMGRHGGGAFSGKDPSKVDRSAAYAARYVAKNIVASGLAKRCEVQISYAIGISKPISIKVETFGTSTVSEDILAVAISEVFDLSPSGMIRMLNLKKPIYQKTSYCGHFGKVGPDFCWEKTDKTEEIKQKVDALCASTTSSKK